MVLGVANSRNGKVQLLKCGNQELYKMNHHSLGAKSWPSHPRAPNRGPQGWGQQVGQAAMKSRQAIGHHEP